MRETLDPYTGFGSLLYWKFQFFHLFWNSLTDAHCVKMSLSRNQRSTKRSQWAGHISCFACTQILVLRWFKLRFFMVLETFQNDPEELFLVFRFYFCFIFKNLFFIHQFLSFFSVSFPFYPLCFFLSLFFRFPLFQVDFLFNIFSKHSKKSDFQKNVSLVKNCSQI